MECQLLLGDCLDRLKELPDNSIDSVVTDPPYGISFLGKKWDAQVPSVEIWKEVLRVLKPGGHLLAFAGTRTQHRMAVNIEDAGFEIRDMLAWVYSGMPKSTNIGIAVDKLTGGAREQGNKNSAYRDKAYKGTNGWVTPDRPEFKTVGTSEWEGWGTGLKPALEPITLARKPIEKNLTIAANVLKHRTGAMNIDDCRVPTVDVWTRLDKTPCNAFCVGGSTAQKRIEQVRDGGNGGRFPANLIHDGSEEAVAIFPNSKGTSGLKVKSGVNKGGKNALNNYKINEDQFGGFNDFGSASRFFYCPKASKADRNEGCPEPRGNFHATVKPTALMQYLCRLITPPNGIVLDPFMGSGSTGKAALLENFHFIGIEKDAEYMEIARCRIVDSSQLTFE